MARNVPPLDVVLLRPLAEGLARRIARQPADVDDLIQVGLFAYITDYRRLRRACKRTVLKNAWALARVILRRAMHGYYGTAEERATWRNESLNQQKRPYPGSGADRPRVLAANDHTAYLFNSGAALVHFASDSHQEQTDLLEMHDYLDALERACGSQARAIVQNLLEPMGECAVRLTMIVREKQRAQRRGYDHGNPRVRFSHLAVRKAMRLSPQTWAESMELVRSFTRAWFDKTA